MIIALEHNNMIKRGLKSSHHNSQLNSKEQKPLWIESVASISKKINIALVSNYSAIITNNITITELVSKNAAIHKLPLNVENKINQVRLRKRVYLPFELFRLFRNKATNCFLR